MTVRRSSDAQAAMQYLVWEIEKYGHQRAAHHARMALKELRRSLQSAEKTDEHASALIPK
jgi:hypothetical protein